MESVIKWHEIKTRPILKGEKYDIKWHKTLIVDGEIIKADTWYKFDDNGNIVED